MNPLALSCCRKAVVPFGGMAVKSCLIAMSTAFNAERAAAGAEQGCGFASAVDCRARNLVMKMTLEEKVSSMCYVEPEIERLGVPSYNWWNEALHGVARAGLATVFPQTIARAATFDPELEERIGRAVAVEARAKYNLFSARGMRERYCGVNLLSPNVNMFRDPRWGRGQETYGEDPYLTGLMGSAYVRGIQHREDGLMKACACAKHFAVHSGPESGRFKFSIDVSERDLREYYLPAFRALVVDAGVEQVMSAYNAVNGVPMTANRRMLTDILRGEWGFGGCVVSDAGATDYLSGGHKMANPVEAAAQAEEAGLDLGIDFAYTNLLDAVKSGRIPESDLDQHLVRLFALRMRMGLLTADGKDAFGDFGAKDVANEEHRRLSRECAEKSLVLVVNRDNALPLDRATTRVICVTGPLAVDAVALYGNYNGYSAKSSCVINGFVEVAGPGTIVRDRHEWNPEHDMKNDAWIVCVGITAEVEGEGENGDRMSYGLDEGQLAHIREIAQVKGSGKLVAVVFGGSPVDLKPLVELCDAVILAWYPGEEGGQAVARVVFGDVNPSGRLPVSFPESYDDLPPFSSYAVDGRTYRYANKRPMFSFGFGLSYTSFEEKVVRVAVENGETIVDVLVKNVGSRLGEDSVCLYVKSPPGAGDRRRCHLEGVKRVRLAPLESRTVEFRLPPSALEVYREDGSRFVPEGCSFLTGASFASIENK